VSLNLLEPSGLVHACNGIALHFTFNIIPDTVHNVTLFDTQDVSGVGYTLTFSCMVVIILAVVLLLFIFKTSGSGWDPPGTS